MVLQIYTRRLDSYKYSINSLKMEEMASFQRMPVQKNIILRLQEKPPIFANLRPQKKRR